MTRLYWYDLLRVSGLSIWSRTADTVFRTAPPRGWQLERWFNL